MGAEICKRGDLFESFCGQKKKKKKKKRFFFFFADRVRQTGYSLVSGGVKCEKETEPKRLHPPFFFWKNFGSEANLILRVP